MSKKEYLLIFFVLLLLLFAATVSAVHQTPYHLKLLAVQEEGDKYLGSDADLYLELKEGSGRVFLETFPLTKMDTQISTRFAKEIACKHFKLDCNQYDFIFTIKAKSNIIGGPSAGAAIAALTTIAVLDLDYDKDITITGTINSGGTIGQVGGVKEKLIAASQAGLKKVLIAKGSGQSGSTEKEETKNKEIETNINKSSTKTKIKNETTTEISLNLIQFAKQNLSLEVVEVSDLDEVLLQLTGKDLNHKPIEIVENPQYQKIMQSLQQLLCDRTLKIEAEMLTAKVFLNNNLSTEVLAKKEKAVNASEREDYYSAASYCFGTNIFLKNQYYSAKKPSKAVLISLFNSLEKKSLALEQKLGQQKIETISDLQTLMVVKERNNAVKNQIKKFKENSPQQPLEDSYAQLAYAEERFFSALSWMQFFSMEGKKFILDQETLKESCTQKISEAEERNQYVSLFLSQYNLGSISEKIAQAQESYQKEEPELCLIKAAEAKAEADAILGSMGLTDENIGDFIISKTKAVQRVISENSAEGIFPILGYSYYQYAKSLQEQDKYIALLYLEYALELSELSIYFPEEQEEPAQSLFAFEFKKEWYYGLGGFGLGLVVMTLIFLIQKIQVKVLKSNPKKVNSKKIKTKPKN
ncbi:MAG TPA: S16 family serine protease [Candidatus Nanoarchaeia archaeon]|nr:S16 family serine protease [Candidatus Nanoarchaeia archaeon]